MRLKKTTLWAIIAGLLTALALTGCTGKILPVECIDVDANYVSLLQWDGVMYYDNTNPNPAPLDKGKEIGKITYSKSEQKCPRAELQDGDATNLKTGTLLYEVEGYKTSARLWAGTGYIWRPAIRQPEPLTICWISRAKYKLSVL